MNIPVTSCQLPVYYGCHIHIHTQKTHYFVFDVRHYSNTVTIEIQLIFVMHLLICIRLNSTIDLSYENVNFQFREFVN